jgi:hygromycin-B 4-O-kinase
MKENHFRVKVGPRSGISWDDAFQKDSQQRRHEPPFYAERLLCYECHHALGALRFFAKSGQEQSYQLTRALILHKLDAFAG